MYKHKYILASPSGGVTVSSLINREAFRRGYVARARQSRLDMGATGSIAVEIEAAPSDIEEFRGSKDCHIDFHIQTEFEGKLDLVNRIHLLDLCKKMY